MTGVRSTRFLPIFLLGDKALTNSYAVYGCRLRIVGMRRRNDYALIATNRSPAKAFLAYQRRWQIEMLFSARKKRGFDIESTQLHFTSLTPSLPYWLSLSLGRIMSVHGCMTQAPSG